MIHESGTEATAVCGHTTEFAAHKCVRGESGRGGVYIVDSEPSRVMDVSGGGTFTDETNKVRSMGLVH